MRRVSNGTRIALVFLAVIAVAVVIVSSTGLNQASAAEGVPVEYDATIEESDGQGGEDDSEVVVENESDPMSMDETEGSDSDGGVELDASASNIASGTWGTCPWEISSDGTLTVHPGTGADTEEGLTTNGYWTKVGPWNGWAATIKKVVIRPEGGRKAVAPSVCDGLFNSLENLVSADLSGLDTSNVTDMSYMFEWCPKLTTVITSGWNTSRVTSMFRMFGTDSSLTSIDVSGWNVSSVTTIYSMFGGCSALPNLDVSNWDTSSMDNMSCAFSECNNLSYLDVSRWDTSSVTDMMNLFYGCKELSSLDVSGWDTSLVTQMSHLFYGCSKLSNLNVSGWTTSRVISMRGMFSGCSSIVSLNLSRWDTSKVTWMSSMFSGCNSLRNLDISGWDTLSARRKHDAESDISGMDYMFTKCTLDEFRVGSGFTCDALNKYNVFPQSSAADGRWWSVSADKWYTSEEVIARLGVADTYRSTASSTTIDISSATISSISNQTYTGSAIKPTPTVKVGSTTLKSGTDYTLSYSNNTNAGTATVTATGKGNYTGTKSATFKIVAANLSDATISSIGDQTYTGSAIKPTPTVKMGSATLKSGTDYTLSYSNNTNVGTATVTATGKGNYTGTKSATFKIVGAQALKLSDLYFSFGNHWDYFNYPKPYRIPIDAYYMIWGKTMAEWMYRYYGSLEWGGNCFGMSSMSSVLATKCGGTATSLFRSGSTVPSQLKVGDKNSSTSKTLTRYIEALQVSQFDEQFAEAEDATFGKLDALCSEVLNAKKSRQPVIVCVYGREGGHAVLAYDVTTQSSTEKRVQIYDPNFQGKARYIKLSTNSSGKCTGWYYKLNDVYNWGSSYSGCAISYIPYATLKNVWTKGGGKHVANMLCANSSTFRLTNVDGAVVADVRDGRLVSSAEGVRQHQILSIAEDGSAWEDRVMLYVPGDTVYTLSNSDSSVGQLEVGMVDSQQSASVVTDASEVTFAVSDDEELNVVDVEAAAGDSYTVTLDSELESATGKENIELSGMGAGATVTLGTVGGECVVGNGRSATLTVNGKVVEMGTRTDISGLSFTLAYKECTFDGKPHEPQVTVKQGKTKLVEGMDYVVKYSANVEVGTATATVYGIGDYTGRKQLQFKVVAPKRFFVDADPTDTGNHGLEVTWMGTSGISTGWEVSGGREFRGLKDVTRCDFAAFLYRMADLADNGKRDDSIKLSDKKVKSVLAGVSDCTTKTSHAAEVAWLIDSGISTGWPDKGKSTVSFRPMAKVARQDMAAFLYRFADLQDNGKLDQSLKKGSEKVTFTDVKSGDTANHAAEVEWLASVGVTKGWSVSGGKYEFRGKKTVARQDMAAFMYRLNGYLNG